MPWPPDVHHLDKSKINTENLDLFLTTLLSGCSMESINSKVDRLKLFIGNDLVYAISNGRIKTPKSYYICALLKALQTVLN